MTKKIAFCGASGVGKSTLGKWISEEYKIPFCPIGSRFIAKQMGFESPYEVDVFGKRVEFQNKLLEEKIKWESEHDSFVTDRTHLDNLVYSIMQDCARSVRMNYIEQCFKACSKYTHIIFLKLEDFINVDNDPSRIKDLGYQKVYEFLLSDFFVSIPYSKGKSHIYSDEFEDNTLEGRKRAIREYLEWK